jgi:hypothetical protein
MKNWNPESRETPTPGFPFIVTGLTKLPGLSWYPKSKATGPMGVPYRSSNPTVCEKYLNWFVQFVRHTVLGNPLGPVSFPIVGSGDEVRSVISLILGNTLPAS